MKNYLFSFGNSNTAAIGCCIRVRIHGTGNEKADRNLALEKARDALQASMTDGEYFQVITQNSDPSQDVEYCNVYINPKKIFLKHIDDWEDEEFEDKAA